MGLVLTRNEIDILTSLDKLKIIKLTDESLNSNTVRQNIVTSVQLSIILDYLGALGIEKDADAILGNKGEVTNDDRLLVAFTQGYSVAIMIAYFQAFNMDRKRSEAPKEFGYKGLDLSFASAILESLSDIVKPESADDALASGLDVKIRDISAEEYFKNGYYNKDIQLLSDILMSDIEDGYNKSMLDAIKNNGDILTKIDTYMTDLEALYRVIFEDGFGIHPYVGVLADSTGFISISNSDSPRAESKRIKDGALTLKKLAERIYLKIQGSVEFSDSRQFNYNEIFTNHKVVYFPNKILEYALGRESSLNLNTNLYMQGSNSSGWDAYYKNYVKGNLRNILIRGFYHAFEKVLMDKKLISSDFISRQTMSSITDYDEFLLKYLSDTAIYSKVINYINKLYDSMRCCYILTKYPYLANKIASIYLRATSSSAFNCFDDKETTSKDLFFGLITTNANEEFVPPFNLSAGRTSSMNVNISANVFEYQYDVNPMLSQAEPLFGYVVQKQNQKKGAESDWNNILIGESMSGKELYASPKSDIKLQNSFTHNIIAGSRSGKGVMTMNILASAVAAGKPIFYLDRKPDMASMLYTLSKGSQFIVNGGLINPKFDVGGEFDESTGNAMVHWRKTVSYLQANPKIMELFDVSNTGYNGILGDYIYLRAFMFCLGLCVLRTKMQGKMDKERDEHLNGNGGIIIVVDELTGFENSINRIISTISSPLVQKALNITDADGILQKKAELEGKIRVAQLKMGEAKKESAQLQAQNEIEKLNAEIGNLIDEQSLYAATFFTKIRDSFATLKSAKVAGFKGMEYDYSDIFVLGQDLEVPYYASSRTEKNKGALSPVFFPLTSDKKDYYSQYKGADIIRSFLEELGELDWFLGRNPDYVNYGDKSIDVRAKKVCDDDGNWEYVGKHTCNEIRGYDPTTYPVSVLFKPYLVLNMHYEEDPKDTKVDDKGNVVASDPRCQYTAQCIDRVNKTAGGVDLWSTVRIKHLTKDAKLAYTPDSPQYNCLNEGIGFKGLVRETLATKDPSVLTDGTNIDDIIIKTLKSSGDAANWVAGKMGYNCWQDLIFDMSVDALFSFDDIVNAVMNPSLYTKESRLPLHAKLGLLGESSTSQLNNQNFDTSDIFGDLQPSAVDEVVGVSTQEPLMSPQAPYPTQSASSTPPDLTTSNRNAGFVYGDAIQNTEPQIVDDSSDYEDDYEDDYDGYSDEYTDSVVEPEIKTQSEEWIRMPESQLRSLAEMCLSFALGNRPEANLSDSQKNAIIMTLVAELQRRGF